MKQLKFLKDNELIDCKSYFYVRPTNLPAFRFHGQQMQKRGVPIPPIVSCSGSQLYNLYKYIANILKKIKDKNVEDEKNNAKNSTMFPNYISNVPILDDDIMA